MKNSSTSSRRPPCNNVKNNSSSTDRLPRIEASNSHFNNHKLLQNSGIIRLSAIFFMTFVHIGFPDVDFFHQWIQNGLGRISAPLLGLLSGYIFMLRPAPSFVSMLMRKGRSLGPPFVIFSGAYILIMYFLTDRYETSLLDIFIGNSFLGVYAWPSNYPLHYLVDLFKVSVLAFIACKVFASWANQYSFLFLSLMIGTLLLIVFGDPFSIYNRYSILPRSDLFAFFFLGMILFKARNILEAILKNPIFRFVLLALSSSIFIYITSSHEWVWINDEETSLHYLEKIGGASIQILARLSGSIVLLMVILYLPVASARTQERMTRFALILFGTHVITMHVVEYYAGAYIDEMNFDQSIFLIYTAFLLVATFLFALEIQVKRCWMGMPWVKKPLVDS